MSPLVLALSGFNMAFFDLEEGLRNCRRAVAIDATHPIANFNLGLVLAERSRSFEEAIPYLEVAAKAGITGGSGLLSWAFSDLGQTAQASEIARNLTALSKKRCVWQWGLACLAAARSDKETYIDALQRSVDSGELGGGFIAVWSFSDFVRDHPRFQALLRSIKLEHVPRPP